MRVVVVLCPVWKWEDMGKSFTAPKLYEICSGRTATTWRFGFAQRLDSSPLKQAEFSVIVLVVTATGRGDHHVITLEPRDK